jgi:hypothetical protein
MALVLRGAREEGREGARCFHELDGCIWIYGTCFMITNTDMVGKYKGEEKGNEMIAPLSSSSSSSSHVALSMSEFAEDVSSTALQRSKPPTTHTIHTISRVESRYMLCTGTARTENRQARTHYVLGTC